MTILVLGLVLCLGVHTLPMFGGARHRLVAALGENGYKAAFRVLFYLFGRFQGQLFGVPVMG